MRKTYVLDTNILLHDPTSLTRFVDNNVIIPLEVIGEIDRFKREASDRGQNARHVSRLLDSLRDGRSLADGIDLDNGVFLRIYWDHATPFDAAAGNADSSILHLAARLRDESPDLPVIIVTKDINLRIRADAMGLRAEDYETDRVVLSDVYSGQTELTLAAHEFETLVTRHHLPLPEDADLLPNQYALVHPENGSRTTLLARREGDAGHLICISQHQDGICGIRSRNKEQYYAVDALLDERIKLVTVMGKAGTGKTLLALACALHQVLVKRHCRGMVVARPTVSLGKEIGFLPGNLGRKMAPWMQPIADTFEFLFDSDRSIGDRNKFASLLASGVIEIQSLSLIRGRSISNRYIVVDEAQNLSPLEVKTIITRVGYASKVVLTGDPYQIDNPYVDSASNGFNYLVDRFRQEPIAAHVELVKGERSELAELAANLL
jgi:PhoH-like ATPase